MKVVVNSVASRVAAVTHGKELRRSQTKVRERSAEVLNDQSDLLLHPPLA